MSETLVLNAIRTPDGTVLESRSRHDYRSYTDENGKTYMVDGGLDYVRCSAHEDQEWVGCYLEDGHEKVREALTWGTYGKNGDQPLRQVKLSEMSNAHIQACLDTQPRMYPQIRTAMENELEYREEQNILIED